MERAGRTLAKWTQARAHLTPEAMAMAAWPAAVGKRLALRARPLALVRERLVVEVDDALWQRNLYALRGQILRKMADLLGEAAPQALEFRVGVPRRPPQVETHAGRTADEAESIADPVLSRIYRISRRKAGA